METLRERLDREHAAITSYMLRIEEELDCPRELEAGCEHRDRVLALVRELAEHLRQHFRCEEQQGLFQAALELSSDRHAEDLLEEHRAFEGRMWSIVAELEAATRVDGELAEHLSGQLRDLFHALRRHETMEMQALLEPEGDPSAPAGRRTDPPLLDRPVLGD